ncbi:MAG: Fic family protein [Gammaproteobacteria bacterium]|nr:Fic family protein [Gammaproteobacteria bacterium]
MWNWQSKKWPNFQWDSKKLVRAESLFIEGAGVVAGSFRHMPSDDRQLLAVELMSAEALDTSEIENEYLDRDSVQSSICRELGLKTDKRIATPAEVGIAEMMVGLYQTFSDPLSESTIFKWHQMLMNGRRDLDEIGSYRTHVDAMQIVSGPDYDRKVHFEAPPSAQVPKEMLAYLEWFSATSPDGVSPLPALTRAAIAHLWFESIHPFEDGNGRIGRAISEKVLAQGFSSPTITVLAKILLKRRKEYYAFLNAASKSLEIMDWILWFAAVAIEAQRNTLAYMDFIINKTKLLDRVRNKLNPRQEKALLRMFREGPNGFKGGLSATNYIRLTGATTASTTRDLRNLVDMGALRRVGERKSTRYFLAMNLDPVATVSVNDIL